MLITGDPTTGQTVDPATAMSRFDEGWQAATVLTGYALVLAVAGASLTNSAGRVLTRGLIAGTSPEE